MGFVFCGVSKLSSEVLVWVAYCDQEWQQIQLSLDPEGLRQMPKDICHGAHTSQAVSLIGADVCINAFSSAR